MPRFVILEHDWPKLHWDFLLESGPVLRAWRLLAEPGPSRIVPAEPNANHRLLYLDYEGPLSGDRGKVRRWDAGMFEWIENGERVVLDLHGAKVVGRCVLVSQDHGGTSVSFA